MPLLHAPLPYSVNALQPYMSARTLEFHHGKHHKAYVDNTNGAVKGSSLEDADLETIVRASKASGDKKLFNNSAQAWNHDFFWHSLAPNSNAAPTGKLASLLERDFGSVDAFKQALKTEALSHFGSGWAWLVLEGGKLRVTSYHDADTPLVYEGVTPLLTIDVWEHAYYLDYQNARAGYLDAVLNHLLNWTGVAERFDRARL